MMRYHVLIKFFIGFCLSAASAFALSEETTDYNKIGQDMAREAFGNTSKPGTTNGGFNFVISNPDGTSTWDTDLGSGPNGHTSSPGDLSDYSKTYGSDAGVTIEATSNPSPAYEEVREVNSQGGHAYFGNDPAMVHMETSMNQMEPDLQDIFNGCKEIESTGKSEQSATTTHACYQIEAPVTDGCSMEHKVAINPIDRTPTAVTILVDKSTSMQNDNRIGAARYAAYKLAELLELSVNTEYAVYAYPRAGNDPPPNEGMGVNYPLTNFDESLEATHVADRYSALRATGQSTPFASASEEAAIELRDTRLEERKIVLVITDGQPFKDGFCPTASPCNMDRVRALYPEIEFAAVGIKTNSVAAHYSPYRIINNNKEMASAMYDLLSLDLNAFEAKDIWTNEPCVETALAVEAGDVEGTLTCEVPPDSDGCANIDGLYVCEGSGFAQDFTTPFETISRVCGYASLSDVDYCFYDDNGVERCRSDPPDDDFETCEDYIADQSCGRVYSECVESSRTENGMCYLYNETYDCNVDNSPAATTRETTTDDGSGTITCDGQEVQCTDDDCLNIPDEENEDFAFATAMIKMSEEVALDTGDCDFDIGKCDIFAGEVMYCKYHAAWGTRDCCEDTMDGSPLEFAAYAYSAYQSYASSQTAATVIGQFASGVMAAYAIYMAANIALDMAADCDEDDQLLYNTKREKLKACVPNLLDTKHDENFYGEYKEKKTWGCCFSSPLARIIQEQVRGYSGRDFYYDNPASDDPYDIIDCGGFTFEEFKAINWAAIDWSEWIDMMYEQERIPEDADVDERYDMTPHHQDDIQEQQDVPDSEEQMEDNHDEAWTGQGQ